jgi:hypothetical protein
MRGMKKYILTISAFLLVGTALAEDPNQYPENLRLWGPTIETFYQLPVGESIVLLAGPQQDEQQLVLENYKTDQLDCYSVPPSYQGSQNANQKWECAALATGNSNSEVFFRVGSERSNTIVIQVEKKSELSVNLQVSDSSINQGDNFNYTISVKNVGSETLDTTGLTIPYSKSSMRPDLSNNGARCSIDSNSDYERIWCHLGDIHGGDTKEVIIPFTLFACGVGGMGTYVTANAINADPAHSNSISMDFQCDDKVSCCFPAGRGVGCEEWHQQECDSRNGTVYDSCSECWEYYESNQGYCCAPDEPSHNQCRDVISLDYCDSIGGTLSEYRNTGACASCKTNPTEQDPSPYNLDISKMMYQEGWGFDGYVAGPLEDNVRDNVRFAGQGMHRGGYPHESFGSHVQQYFSEELAEDAFDQSKERSLLGDAHFLVNQSLSFGDDWYCYIGENYMYNSGDCGGHCQNVTLPYRNIDCRFRDENIIVNANSTMNDDHLSLVLVDEFISRYTRYILGHYESRLDTLASGRTPSRGTNGGGETDNPVPPREIPPAGYEDEVIVNFDAYDNPFPDTSLSSLEGRAAAELYRRAVIGGFPDGEFKGDRNVNRAEAAKFLLLARFGTVNDVANSGRFPDVVDGQWYTKFVVTAANKGIISGHPDGTFRPADNVNTAEFLKMLALTFDLQLNLPHSYNDVSSQDWFAKFAGIAQKYDLFPGRTNYLLPGDSLTREEVAVAIYQYLQNR